MRAYLERSTVVREAFNPSLRAPITPFAPSQEIIVLNVKIFLAYSILFRVYYDSCGQDWWLKARFKD